MTSVERMEKFSRSKMEGLRDELCLISQKLAKLGFDYGDLIDSCNTDHYKFAVRHVEQLIFYVNEDFENLVNKYIESKEYIKKFEQWNKS